DGAGFHIVLKGGCWLLTDGGTSVSLGVGDAVLLPHGTGHVIADSPVDAAIAANKAVPFEQWLADTEQRAAPDHYGTEMLSGKYWLDCSRVHPLMAELPEVVHLPSQV